MKVLLVLLTLGCTCLAMSITTNTVLSQDTTQAKNSYILMNSKLFEFLNKKLPNCPTGSSSEEYIIIANPNDCESYFICREAYPVLQKCPKGQRFDNKKLQCRNAIEVECNIPNPGESTTTTDPISSTIESITTITIPTEPSIVSTSDPVVSTTEDSITITEIITNPTTTTVTTTTVTTDEPNTTTVTTDDPTTTTVTTDETTVTTVTTDESTITTVATDEPTTTTVTTDDPTTIITTENPVPKTTPEESISPSTTAEPITTITTVESITTSKTEESITSTEIITNPITITTCTTKKPITTTVTTADPTTIVTTENPVTGSSTTSASATVTPIPLDCSTAKCGFLPNTEDCTKYYQCVGANPVHMECSAGLKWNSDLCTCDHMCVH